MGRTPTEPEPSPWVFPDPSQAEGEFVAAGADLAPGTLLAAYRSGLFPMPLTEPDDVDAAAQAGDGMAPIGWWSPDPRGIIELDDLRVSRSLRRSMRRFRVTFDTCFEQVMGRCAAPGRDGGWINEAFIVAYTELHRLGWARSVEVWDDQDGPGGQRLVGGLYGVAIGDFFAGESMFSEATDASKVALAALVDELTAGGCTLLDVQWCTDHLRTLGAIEIERTAYLRRLNRSVHASGARRLGHSNDSQR